jgi:hypothetical protein
MMDFVSRPHILPLPPPSSTFAADPLRVRRSTLSASIPALPLPRPSISFGQLSDYSIRTNDARTLASFTTQTASAPSIAPMKQSVPGLQTPPPEMTAHVQPQLPQSNSQDSFRSLDNPITSSEVSGTLDTMQNTTQQQEPVDERPNSPSRQQSGCNDVQPTEPTQQIVRNGTTVAVPSSIGTGRSLIAEFAAQVHNIITLTQNV